MSLLCRPFLVQSMVSSEACSFPTSISTMIGGASRTLSTLFSPGLDVATVIIAVAVPAHASTFHMWAWWTWNSGLVGSHSHNQSDNVQVLDLIRKWSKVNSPEPVQPCHGIITVYQNSQRPIVLSLFHRKGDRR